MTHSTRDIRTKRSLNFEERDIDQPLGIVTISESGTGKSLGRTLVFISHANPEDNEFTLWLASRLTDLGYLVWSDLTKLIGAEVFWDDIEEAIRIHAAKVLIVLSKISQQKAGVQNEIAVAAEVERSHNIKHFTVPIRIDDLPYGEIRANLIRKNVIEAGANWADGLRRIVEVLERDLVPKSQHLPVRESSAWLQDIVAGSNKIQDAPEVVLSNQFDVVHLPEHLRFYRAPVDKKVIQKQLNSANCTVYPYGQLIASFATRDDLQGLLPAFKRVTEGPQLSIEAILNDHPRPLPELEGREARNILVYLLRAAWDKKMNSLGLYPYELSSSLVAWYPVKGEIGDDWVRFNDLDGKEKRIKLVGASKKYNVHWHFGMAIRPLIGRTVRILLTPHIVFTEDGKTPLQSSERMHRLRRGFCKLWWNDRWRKLLLGYMALLKDDADLVLLEVGSDQLFQIGSIPTCFASPVSLEVPSNSSEEVDLTDDELDEMVEESDLNDLTDLEIDCGEGDDE